MNISPKRSRFDINAEELTDYHRLINEKYQPVTSSAGSLCCNVITERDHIPHETSRVGSPEGRVDEACFSVLTKIDDVTVIFFSRI